jgi:hypothetical protein
MHMSDHVTARHSGCPSISSHSKAPEKYFVPRLAAQRRQLELLICQSFIDSPRTHWASRTENFTSMLPGRSLLPPLPHSVVRAARRSAVPRHGFESALRFSSLQFPKAAAARERPHRNLSTSARRAAYQAPPPRKSRGPVKKMTTEAPTTLKGQPFDKVVLDGLLRRRMFYTPSFEVGRS